MIGVRSSSSRRTVPIQRSAIAFARGARTGVRKMRMPSLANTASKTLVNLLSRSRIRNTLAGAASVYRPPSGEIGAVWLPLASGPGVHQPLCTAVPVISVGAWAVGIRGWIIISLPQSVSQFWLR